MKFWLQIVYTNVHGTRKIRNLIYAPPWFQNFYWLINSLQLNCSLFIYIWTHLNHAFFYLFILYWLHPSFYVFAWLVKLKNYSSQRGLHVLLLLAGRSCTLRRRACTVTRSFQTDRNSSLTWLVTVTRCPIPSNRILRKSSTTPNSIRWVQLFLFSV